MIGLEIGALVAIMLIVALVLVRRSRKMRATRVEQAEADRQKKIATRRKLLDDVDNGNVEAAHELHNAWDDPRTEKGGYVSHYMRAEMFACGDDGLYNRFDATFQKASDTVVYGEFATQAESLHYAWGETVGKSGERAALARFLRMVYDSYSGKMRERYAKESRINLEALHARLADMFHGEGRQLVAQINDEPSLEAYIELQGQWYKQRGSFSPETPSLTYWPSDEAWNDLVDRVVPTPTRDHYRNLPKLKRPQVAMLAATALSEGCVGQAKRALAYCRERDNRSFVGDLRINELYSLIASHEPFHV